MDNYTSQTRFSKGNSKYTGGTWYKLIRCRETHLIPCTPIVFQQCSSSSCAQGLRKNCLTLYLQTIVKEGIDDFDSETRGTVQAVVLRVIRWTRVHVECDIRSRRRRRWPRFRRRPRWTGVCQQKSFRNYLSLSTLRLAIFIILIGFPKVWKERSWPTREFIYIHYSFFLFFEKSQNAHWNLLLYILYMYQIKNCERIQKFSLLLYSKRCKKKIGIKKSLFPRYSSYIYIHKSFERIQK